MLFSFPIIFRALKAGMKNPLLATVPNKLYPQAELVAAIGAFHVLHVPLNVREEENKTKVNSITLMPFGKDHEVRHLQTYVCYCLYNIYFYFNILLMNFSFFYSDLSKFQDERHFTCISFHLLSDLRSFVKPLRQLKCHILCVVT